MSIPKRRSRRVCVDGVQYRWVARQLLPTDVRIVVQAVEWPGALLILRTDQAVAVKHVPPSPVALAIRAARAEGWESQRPGPPFESALVL